jgi:single-strand DNA-binding protein
MSGFNQAVLLGRLAAPPEELKTKSGKLFLRAIIATNVYQKSAEGVNEERTSFVPITIFGRTAEVFRDFVQKGDMVHLVGRLDSREYKTDAGEKRLTLGLIVEQLHLLPNERKNAATDAGEGL